MRRPLVMISQSRSRRERLLVFLLRGTGIVMMTGLVFCVCPFAWMDSIHKAMGLGPLPNTPIMQYLTRSLSGMYAYLGMMLWFLAGDIRRHRGTLAFLSITGLFFSVGIIILDWTAGMPWFWTAAEGPATLLLCVVLLYLLGRVP